MTGPTWTASSWFGREGALRIGGSGGPTLPHPAASAATIAATAIHARFWRAPGLASLDTGATG